MHQPSKAPERISLGMEVIAVAVGVGYGVVDTITRRVHRHDDPPRGEVREIDLRDDTRVPAAV